MKINQTLKLILIGIVIIVIAIIIYFNISYSPLKNNFKRDLDKQIEKQATDSDEVFTEADFADFPHAFKMYIKNNGYIGTPKMDYVHIYFKDIDFYQSFDKKLVIDYNQYNFAHHPARLAIIDTSMAGIPFEGYDYYIDGVGGMHGMLAKAFSLFHEKGAAMDRGALCTYLCESVLLPSSLLYTNINFEEIGPYKVKATIADKEKSVSGIYTFNENYEITSFKTTDRPAVKEDGSIEYIPWSASFDEYVTDENGINRVAKVSVTWHYPDRDFTYFEGDVESLIFH